MVMRVKGLAAAGFTCAVLALSACSGASGDGAAGAGGGDGPTLTITAPEDGADVRNPVTLTFTSSEEIGEEETGKDHVHVSIDGKTNDYVVVTGTTYRLANLTPGRHLIGVTLQHADHSDAGASAQVNVNVTGGGGDSGDPPADGGGGYGYP